MPSSIFKKIAKAVGVLALLCACILGIALYTAMPDTSEVLQAPDGSKYVEFTPSFSWYSENCGPSMEAYPLAYDELVLDGYRRSFYYYKPTKLAPDPMLLFVIHGSGGNGESMHRLLGNHIGRLAEKYGFIAIYPNGFGGGWNDLRTKSPHLAKALKLNEPEFFRQVIDRAEERFGIDRDNIFYFGMSNGGQMTLKLLVEAPEIVTAAAVIGTNLPNEEFIDASYNNLQARPVMFVHGTDDDIVPYRGGPVRLWYILSFGDVYSAPETVQHWVRAAGLQHPPEEARIDTQHDRTSIDLQRWHEPGKMEVRAYRVNGGGHTIPLPSNADECTNIAAPSRDMNTVYEAWNFFLGNRRHSSAQ